MSKTIYILIETKAFDEEETAPRSYFFRRENAIERAKKMMDESLPKRRKTRDDDIRRAIDELDSRNFTNDTMLYNHYRIETAEVN